MKEKEKLFPSEDNCLISSIAWNTFMLQNYLYRYHKKRTLSTDITLQDFEPFYTIPHLTGVNHQFFFARISSNSLLRANNLTICERCSGVKPDKTLPLSDDNAIE